MVLVVPLDDRRRKRQLQSDRTRLQRGYGLSDPPPKPENASIIDSVHDMVTLLNALDIPKIHYRNLDELKLILVALMPKQLVVWNIYVLFSKSEIPIAGENKEIMDMVEPSTPLPPWFTEEDMAAYGALYEKSGFQTALQVPYRSMHKHLDIPDPKVEVPAMLIMGEDYVFKFPGIVDYIKSGEAFIGQGIASKAIDMVAVFSEESEKFTVREQRSKEGQWSNKCPLWDSYQPIAELCKSHELPMIWENDGEEDSS
ncbi:hypothetical protein RHMOL_Rhmol02G0137200 [Rhododendron molle]|uniref:Uncharacterized protein n=1 Tax=Rhododendron molle TaxID=49168 RepID=A0ACC0PRF6_RHOML|nr:hypothetical protein RHMOL_Rhmol02G0137200 [Rhododendron molle]